MKTTGLVYVYWYVKHTLLFFACCSLAAEVFFWHFRLRGKQGGLRYITTHVGIPAELRGDTLSVQRVAELAIFF